MKIGKYQIHISKGNSKLGKVASISLIPVKDCANCAACKKDCYALKAWRLYPNVRKCWGENSKAFRKDQYKAFNLVYDWIDKNKPKFFRWHVAGDILDQSYFDYMASIAEQFPLVKFLAFTKRHDLDYSDKPKNLAIVLSMFPGMPKPSAQLPLAWLQDGTETRIPKSAANCPGNCETCGYCFNLKNGQSVFFAKH